MMVKLPVFSGEKVVKVFKNAGWIVARKKGSHIINGKEGAYSQPIYSEA